MATSFELQPLLDSIRVDAVEIAKLEGQLAERKGSRVDKTRTLRHRIAAGVSTGDRLHDLVILAGGDVDDPRLPRCRELEAVLSGKKGEFVLLSFSADVRDKHTSIKGYSKRREHCCRVGVLSGEDLVLGRDITYDFGVLSVPVPCYVHTSVRFIPLGGNLPRLHLTQAGIFSCRFGGFVANPEPLLTMLSDDLWRDHIIVGDRAVEAWLVKSGMPGLFRYAAEALGKLVLEPTDESTL